MRFKFRHLFLLAPLLVVTAVQAAPNGPLNPGEAHNADSQPGKSANVKGTLRSGSRYGIGYEARHGMDAGIRENRGDRMERPEHPERIERIERPERAERDGRGR